MKPVWYFAEYDQTKIGKFPTGTLEQLCFPNWCLLYANNQQRVVWEECRVQGNASPKMFSQLQQAVENPPFFSDYKLGKFMPFSPFRYGRSVITRLDYFDWLHLQLNVKTSHKFQKVPKCLLASSMAQAMGKHLHESVHWLQYLMQILAQHFGPSFPCSQWMELWTLDGVGWLQDG